MNSQPALLERCAAAVAAAERHLATLTRISSDRLFGAGAEAGDPFDRHQFHAHGYAWCASYVHALRELQRWGAALAAAGRLGEMESLILLAGFGGYLAQLGTGIPMGQDEIVRPADMGAAAAAAQLLADPAVAALVREGGGVEPRLRIAELARRTRAGFGDDGDDETLALTRAQFRRFVDREVTPHAHGWHRADALVPDAVLAQMADMGVFGISLPERWGGLGMSKRAMCVITEELSRGYIGVGSIATRSEIAATLIIQGGTDVQRDRYLPPIAAGRILPAALFSEPGAGSDLAGVSTRAVRSGNRYRITGAKTWATHAGRADLLTLLARTQPQDPSYRGISLILVDKPRGTEENMFPLPGMSGSPIPVLGYRGMREYALQFDGLEVPAGALLGANEGNGFKQVMGTLEVSRIQTAARGVGVAQNALELALDYACERVQFGQPLVAFPRVAAKIGWMIAEQMMVRQLTYHSAICKDTGARADIEAGMAKLLSARMAWSCADNALQIHGGNGYAVEFPISRVFCDARILSVFEGSAEIQAQVIAKGLLRPPERFGSA
ncbi:MAG: acyl-CoA dehydrogenase family protein [Gammaproteobacteria bacterium]